MNEESHHKSELGLKKYWDSHYQEEIGNYDEHGDVGEIWFGRGITSKMVSWIQKHYTDKETTRIIDIGCGNGFMLNSLLKVGYEHLTGVDYSHEAILLAKKIASNLPNGSCITFSQQDILQDASENDLPEEKFNVMVDKGTFDAICLNPAVDDIQSLIDGYIHYISQRLHPDGHFIICSCNWTKEELCNHFSRFKLIEEIPSSSMQFGGQKGNRVTCLIFTSDGT